MNTRARWLIISSLVLNVLLVGIIIGHTVKRMEFRERRMERIAVQENVPEAIRKQFHEVMRSVHKENRDLHREAHEARVKALDILVAEPFDEAAYQAQTETLHRLRGEMMQRMADATKTLALSLPPKERSALAEMLKHPPRPPRR